MAYKVPPVEPEAVLSDAEGNAVLVGSEGVLRHLTVADPEARDILGKILDELRVLNLHLEIMTGQDFTRSDLEK